MKVVAFNGSPRKNGNTGILIRFALQELKNEGFDTELVQLSGKKIRGCTACMKCFENRDKRCIIDSDIVNTCIEKMIAADGIILGSPVYFTDVTAEMKALIDRAGFVSMANGGLYRRKVGGVLLPCEELVQCTPQIPSCISCLPVIWSSPVFRGLGLEVRLEMSNRIARGLNG